MWSAWLPGCRAGWAGFHGPRVSFLVDEAVSGWSAGCEGVEPADAGGDLVCPGPAGGDAEPEPSAAADDAPGGGEDPKPQFSGFPAAGGAGEGEHLGPGQQLAAQRDELAPDLVLVVAVQRQVAQAGVLGGADASPGVASLSYDVAPDPFAESFCITSSWVWCSLSLLL